MAASAPRYGTLPMALHWLTVVLVAAAFACIELREWFPRGSEPREALKAFHFSLGLTVLGLTVLRLLVRGATAPPPIHPAPTPLQARAAAAVHGALYLLLLILPLSGWLLLGADGKTAAWLGLELPALAPRSENLAEAVEELHEALGTVVWALVGLHAIAALIHHYAVHDDTLRRMLPGWARTQRPPPAR